MMQRCTYCMFDLIKRNIFNTHCFRNSEEQLTLLEMTQNIKCPLCSSYICDSCQEYEKWVMEYNSAASVFPDVPTENNAAVNASYEFETGHNNEMDEWYDSDEQLDKSDNWDYDKEDDEDDIEEDDEDDIEEDDEDYIDEDFTSSIFSDESEVEEM